MRLFLACWAGCFLALIATGQKAPDRPDLAGEWIDSLGNLYYVDGSVAFTLKCPRCQFVVRDRVYDLPLQLNIPVITLGKFKAHEMNGGPLLAQGSISSSGEMRLLFSIPGAIEKVDIALARREHTHVSDRPGQQLVIELPKPSVGVGHWIPLYVYLADSSGKITAPDKDVVVQMVVQGGTPIPPMVKLTREVPKVPAGIANVTRQATITASAGGFNDAVAMGTVCAESPANELHLTISSPRDTARADGLDAIPIIFTLVNGNDTPASALDNHPKQFGFQVGGVGRLTPELDSRAFFLIPGQECSAERKIIAYTAGESVVSTEFHERKLTKALTFWPILTVSSIFLVVLGGGIGGFVSAGKNYAAAIKWKWKRWFYWMSSACISAVTLYLGYFYGLVKQSVHVPSDGGFAMLIGLLGGYLGSYAFDLLVNGNSSGAVERRKIQ